MTRKLGKRPARHDPRTYRLAPFLATQLPVVPDAHDWSAGVPYQMWGNDTYGCCAFAAYAALLATWTQAAQALVLLPTKTVLAAYGTVTGFDPVTGANDNGTVLLDELNYWRRNGLPRTGQPDADYLTAFGAISPTDEQSIKRAVCYLGGVLAGVQVPRGFLSLGLGETWDLDKLKSEDLQYEGGHAIALTGYTPDGVFFNTWGTRTFMPWSTFTAIADEAYGLLSRQNWLTTKGTSPLNESIEALVHQLQAV